MTYLHPRAVLFSVSVSRLDLLSLRGDRIGLWASATVATYLVWRQCQDFLSEGTQLTLQSPNFGHLPVQLRSQILDFSGHHGDLFRIMFIRNSQILQWPQ